MENLLKANEIRLHSILLVITKLTFKLTRGCVTGGKELYEKISKQQYYIVSVELMAYKKQMLMLMLR